MPVADPPQLRDKSHFHLPSYLVFIVDYNKLLIHISLVTCPLTVSNNHEHTVWISWTNSYPHIYCRRAPLTNQTQIVLAEFPTWTHTASRIELELSMKTQTKTLFRTTKKGRALTKDEGTGLDSFPAWTSLTYVPWEHLEGVLQREHKQDCRGVFAFVSVNLE